MAAPLLDVRVGKRAEDERLFLDEFGVEVGVRRHAGDHDLRATLDGLSGHPRLELSANYYRSGT